MPHQPEAGLAETAEVVVSESYGRSAWPAVAARLARPVPRMVAVPTRAEVQDVMVQAAKTNARVKGDFAGQAVLADVLNNGMRAALRRWVDSRFLVPDHRGSGRGVLAELHHDGAVTVSADLAHGLKQTNGPVRRA